MVRIDLYLTAREITTEHFLEQAQFSLGHKLKIIAASLVFQEIFKEELCYF